MYIQENLQKSLFVPISKQEKDRLYYLYDFMDSIHPVGLDDIDYEGHCDGCEIQWQHLWDAYNKAECAFKLILQQILISNDLGHLNSWLEKYDEETLSIIFAEEIHPEGRVYLISLRGLTE